MTYMILDPKSVYTTNARLIQASSLEEAKKKAEKYYPGWRVVETETFMDASNDCLTYRPKSR